MLNNRQVVLLRVEGRGEPAYVGVVKHLPFCQFVEQREPPGKVQALVNQSYYSLSNCHIEHISESRAKSVYFMPCLWEVLHNNPHSNNYTYLFRSGE